MDQGPARSRRAHPVQIASAAILAIALLAPSLVGAPAVAASAPQGTRVVVAGHRSIPSLRRQAGPLRSLRLTTRQRLNLDRRAGIRARAAADRAKAVRSGRLVGAIDAAPVGTSVGATSPAGVLTSWTQPSTSVDATVAAPVTPGLQATDLGSFGGTISPADAFVAAGPDDLLTLANAYAVVVPRDGSSRVDVGPIETFFGVPATEGAWAPQVAWDALHGRWIAVVTSWESDPATCATGYLRVAVSSGADPRGTWTRWAIPLGGSYADRPILGLTDDKVLLGDAEYPIDPDWAGCLGLPFSGSRLRAIDWADLLDGGTATVADITPTEANHYWAWQPAVNVTTTGSSTSDADGHLVVDAYDTAGLRWGNVVSGTVTGHVLGGTVALDLTDLTDSSGAPRFDGPPYLGSTPGYVMAPGLGSDSGIDEGPSSAVWQSGHLWFGASASCTPSGDSTDRGCLRVGRVDTGAPSLVQDVRLGQAGTDRFVPAVGVGHDGTLYIVGDGGDRSNSRMSVVGSWRDAGAALSATKPMIALKTTENLASQTSWQATAAVASEPDDDRAVVVAEPLSEPGLIGGPLFRLIGGLSGAPAGSASTPTYAEGWQTTVSLVPDDTSPITAVRLSSSPTTFVDLNGQTVLQLGTTMPSQTSVFWNLMSDDSQHGGSATEGPRAIYAQWGTGDGTWSPVVSTSLFVDVTPPTLSSLGRELVAPSALGTTVKVRYSWAGDPGVGAPLREYIFRSIDCGCLVVLPTPLTTTVTRSLKPGTTYHDEVSAVDEANVGGTAAFPATKVRLTQQSSSSVHYSGTWKTVTTSKASGGSLRYATKKGAFATYKFTGSSIAFVATKGSGRGTAQVYVDGVLQASISTAAGSTHYRQVLFATSWPSSGSHTIKIRLAGNKRVDVDAFLAL